MENEKSHMDTELWDSIHKKAAAVMSEWPDGISSSGMTQVVLGRLTPDERAAFDARAAFGLLERDYDSAVKLSAMRSKGAKARRTRVGLAVADLVLTAEPSLGCPAAVQAAVDATEKAAKAGLSMSDAIAQAERAVRALAE